MLISKLYRQILGNLILIFAFKVISVVKYHYWNLHTFEFSSRNLNHLHQRGGLWYFALFADDASFILDGSFK